MLRDMCISYIHCGRGSLSTGKSLNKFYMFYSYSGFISVLLLPCGPYEMYYVIILPASSQTLPCQLAGGTSCPTMICPNTAVNYTCNVGSYAGNTVWNVPSVGVCSGTLTLAQAPPAPGLSCLTSSSSGTCGPFTVTNTPPLTSSVNCLTSTLSVVVTSAMNGLVVSCSSYSILSFTTTPVGNATISVVGKYGVF